MSPAYNISGNGNYCRYRRFQHLFFFFVKSYDSLYCPTTTTDDAPTTPLGVLIVHLYCLSTFYYYYYNIVRTPTPSRLTTAYHYTITLTC